MHAKRTKPPRNIIRFDQVCGREIKDWIWFHSHNPVQRIYFSEKYR